MRLDAFLSAKRFRPTIQSIRVAMLTYELDGGNSVSHVSL